MSRSAPAAVVGVCGAVGTSATAALARAACGDDVQVVELLLDADDAVAIVPEVGVVTTVAGAEADLVGAIMHQVRSLSAASTAVLDVDDPQLSDLAGRLDAGVLWVSDHDRPGADLVARDVSLDDRARPTFSARTPWGDAEVALPVSGRHHVPNALCALAAACVTGTDLAVAVAGLLDADSPRGAAHELDGLLLLDETGQATRVSTLAALDTLGAMRITGQRVGVLGPMDVPAAVHETEHWRVGMRAAGILDRLVVVGEAATPITAGARDAAVSRVELADDAAAALDALGDLGRGDAVLVTGGRSAGLEAVVEGLRAPRRKEGIDS